MLNVMWKYKINKHYDRTIRWIAWHLPKRLVMWAAFRVISHATTGKYSNQNVPELTAMDAMKRWETR